MTVPFVCPDCRGPLDPRADGHVCRRCFAVWPDSDGFPCLYREAHVGRMDRFMRLFYDGLPRLHDPLTTHLLPRLQGEGSEQGIRDAVMDAVDLESLGGHGPIDVLEVGVGAGANLPVLAGRLVGRPARVHGVDLSRGMLSVCRRRLPVAGLDVTLSLGDAHRLPFADHAFDRVFHVGAAGTWARPEHALAELARVAKPGTPIVVVDEQLDRSRRPSVRDRLAFRLLTFYDARPGAPVDLVPTGATDIRVAQISRFFYALTFAMPEPTRSTIAPKPTPDPSATISTV